MESSIVKRFEIKSLHELAVAETFGHQIQVEGTAFEMKLETLFFEAFVHFGVALEQQPGEVSGFIFEAVHGFFDERQRVCRGGQIHQIYREG